MDKKTFISFVWAFVALISLAVSSSALERGCIWSVVGCSLAVAIVAVIKLTKSLNELQQE